MYVSRRYAMSSAPPAMITEPWEVGHGVLPARRRNLSAGLELAQVGERPGSAATAWFAHAVVDDAVHDLIAGGVIDRGVLVERGRCPGGELRPLGVQ
jgi:hypothetical protein